MPAKRICSNGVSSHTSYDSFSGSIWGRNVTSQLRDLVRLGSDNTKTLVFFVARSSGVTWEACRDDILCLQDSGHAGGFAGLLLAQRLRGIGLLIIRMVAGGRPTERALSPWEHATIVGTTWPKVHLAQLLYVKTPAHINLLKARWVLLPTAPIAAAPRIE